MYKALNYLNYFDVQNTGDKWTERVKSVKNTIILLWSSAIVAFYGQGHVGQGQGELCDLLLI